MKANSPAVTPAIQRRANPLALVHPDSRKFATASDVIDGCRVLVIDDHHETAESLTAALRYEGYDARFECSSIEGIAATHSWLPDVVILDADMPERNGFETAAIIRGIVPNPDLVIIAFTGLDLAAGPQTAYRSGFDGYCQKAQPLQTLLDTIKTVRAVALP